MKLNEYRLNSQEEPSDELLDELMAHVAEDARKSFHNAELEKDKRLKDVERKIKSFESNKRSYL